MDLLAFVLDPANFLLFGHLGSLEVSRDYGWFTSKAVLASDDRQFEIIGLVHF